MKTANCENCALATEATNSFIHTKREMGTEVSWHGTTQLFSSTAA